MRRSTKLGIVACAALASAGCYHVTVETGRTPGRILETRWASGWIYGLVPPETINTASDCPEGVARVETQLSFLNGAVIVLTFGIYTPWHVTVTCAKSISALPGQMIDVGEAGRASPSATIAALDSAARLSGASGKPVYVRF